MRYHNRYIPRSDSNGNVVPWANIAMSSSSITSTTQHQSTTTNIPQAAISSSNREQVYPLGSREDVQQDDYESPLAGMFGRAYGRYREAETARQEARAHGYEAVSSWNRQGQFTTEYRPAVNPLLDPAWAYYQSQIGQAQTQDNTNVRLGQFDGPGSSATDTTEVTRMARNAEDHATHTGSSFGRVQALLDPRASRVVPLTRPRFRTNFHRQFYTNNGVLPPPNNPFEHDDEMVNPIDAQQHRPSPTKSEDLKVDLACKICTEQKINTVCMPCMHACMCRWCAAIHKNDCRDYDTGRWSGALWKCPICRKSIQEVKKLYL